MIKRARRSVAAVAAALSLGISGAAWAASSAASASTTPARPVAAVPECRSGQLAVWVAVDMGQGAAGSIYYPLEFTNVSNRKCYLIGWPGVSAIGSRDRQLGDAATRDSSLPRRTVIVAPGATAHAILRYAQVVNFPRAVCRPAPATVLRVYPPDQKVSRTAFFSLMACSAKGPVYLTITRIEPGLTIP